MEFPIGKKLFHLVVNPGSSRCPTVDLELVQTTRNVKGTRHSVRKFQPGKRAHLFTFSTFSGNFPVGRTDETCSIYRSTENFGNFDLIETALYYLFACVFKYIYFSFFVKKKEGSRKGSRRGSKKGSKRGSRREGPRFVYTQLSQGLPTMLSS